MWLLFATLVLPTTGQPPPRPAAAPLAAKAATWDHAPYGAGACSLCHARDDATDPGPVVTEATPELCFGCHETLQAAMAARTLLHAPAQSDCLACHNPHNATNNKLLHDSAPGLCFSCHTQMEESIAAATVKHDAVTEGRACLACHNPHASNVEHMLRALPFDLCVTCHNTDTLVDDQQRKLTNMAALLADSTSHHAPVASKDCSACHTVHGGDNFRLLVKAYPAEFYSSYKEENYALCFHCHNSQLLENARTTTLTMFRNGDTNLHYQHVRKRRQGRTCRACHEVHAANKSHQIRDSVPFGRRGWTLPVEYTESKTGGACDRTCHTRKEYANRPALSRADTTP